MSFKILLEDSKRMMRYYYLFDIEEKPKLKRLKHLLKF
jgi:hypothetical protein